MNARDIANLVGSQVVGDPEQPVDGVAEPASATDRDLVFILDEGVLRDCRDRSFGTVITTLDPRSIKAAAVIRVTDGKLAMAGALASFYREHRPATGIHPDAFVEEDVLLGERVRVGAYAYISTEASVGSDSVIYPHVYIGRGARVGRECVIMPGVYIHDNTDIGDRVRIGPSAVIGYDGFGFAAGEKGLVKIPQVGKVVIEDDCEIGAGACVDRATIGETRIKKGTKIDNLVQIGHNVQVGEGTAIASQAGVAGSSRVGKGVLIAGQVGVADHLRIGDEAIITAKSGVSGHVPPKGVWSSGVPARDRMLFLKCMTLFYKLPELFERVRNLEKHGQENPGK